MSNKNTYYDILEIAEVASAEDIRQAYRKLIKIWHPDLHPGDESAAIKTREINEAYEVLSDPVKKAQYDEYLSLSRHVSEDGERKQSNASDPFDMEFGDMSFKEYAEYVSKGAYKTYRESSRPQSSRVDDARYREYAESKKSVTKNEVNLLPLIRAFLIVVVVVLVILLFINRSGIFPDFESNDNMPFPVLLLIIIIICSIIFSLVNEKKSKSFRKPDGIDSIVEADKWFEMYLRPDISKAECRDVFFSFSIRADRHILRRFEAMSEEDKEQYSAIMELLKDCIEYREK